jgi:hypothetical protein
VIADCVAMVIASPRTHQTLQLEGPKSAQHYVLLLLLVLCYMRCSLGVGLHIEYIEYIYFGTMHAGAA